MSKVIPITQEDILQQVKLTGKMPELIEGIVAGKIIKDAAAEMDITVETEELQEAADKFRLMKKLASAEATWKWLEEQGLSLDEFEDMIHNVAISSKLAAHLFGEKLEPYFFEHKLDYTGVVMYEVILEDEDVAMELFYAIQEKEMSFSDVAHKYIQDTELRRQGGYKGVVNRKKMKPEVSAAVFAAQPPQLLKPIVTSRGVHLIFLEEIIEPKLDNLLRWQIGCQLFDEWLKQRSKEVEVSYLSAGANE